MKTQLIAVICSYARIICQDNECKDGQYFSCNDFESDNDSVAPIKKIKTVFLTAAGVTSKTMSPRKTIMYKIHRKITAQLCKNKKKLGDERNALTELKSMHDKHMFDYINEKLNDVTKHFINSQL